VPNLDGYAVRFGSRWNGTNAGDEVTIEGALPAPELPHIPKQVFFLPVAPGHDEPIEGILERSDGLRFTIAGPGRYLMGNDGLQPAP
jgi:hypothetical protein